MSRFALSRAAFSKRLANAEMNPKSLELMQSYIDHHFDDDDVGLWIDEPWVELDYEELASDAQVAITVLTEPLDLDEGLELRDTAIHGNAHPRDHHAWVFLGPVRCRDLTTLPDVYTVFAGGLSVERVACFSAGDATTYVEKRLEAAILLSGAGRGSVDIAAGCSLAIGAFHSYISSFTADFGELLPFVAERFEDEDAWEVVTDLIDESIDFPADFELPEIPR